MDFELSEQQAAFRDLMRDFARKSISPVAREWELAGRYPEEIVEEMKAMGLFGMLVPEEYGGIAIDAAPRLHGHSDGDVALHAVCDALLGAAGLGDLGRIFPPGPATPAGIASRELVAECVRRVRAAGFAPLSVDLTIIGARPRLAARLPEMRDAIAGLLALSTDRVNVKASTGNLAGWEGAGRGISARAVAVVGERRG